MGNNPLISVVITTYNVESYIVEAIQSILDQTIQNFEIVIVDDYSTDNTVQNIKSISSQKIVLISNTFNKGRVQSLNIAFQNAKGKYITITDGDDINVLNRFEKQLNILENNPTINVCGSWYQEFGYRNRIIKHFENHETIKAKMLLSCAMTFGGSMFERKLVENFVFDQSKLHVEDYDFWAKIIWKGKFYNIQEVLYYYRIHKNQVSTAYNHIQKQNDIAIKLFLYKKINYDITIYSDAFIKKMLLQESFFTLAEFSLFVNWLQEIYKINKVNNTFNSNELIKILTVLKRDLIYKIYFYPNFCGIDKKWRTNALYKLPLPDLLFVIKLKIKEKLKLKK